MYEPPSSVFPNAIDPPPPLARANGVPVIVENFPIPPSGETPPSPKLFPPEPATPALPAPPPPALARFGSDVVLDAPLFPKPIVDVVPFKFKVTFVALAPVCPRAKLAPPPEPPEFGLSSVP